MYNQYNSMKQMSAQNPSNPHMVGSIHDAFDKIASYLYEGLVWHNRMANQTRKLHIRGLGRWHEAEAKGDFCMLECFEKLLGDKCWYYPNVDMKKAEESSKLTLDSIEDFKAHFNHWIKREEELIDILNYAVSESRSVDIEIYEKLVCLLKEVQNEKMRAQWAYDRFNLAGWNGHDLGVVSMVIHDYFECKYKQGDMIDFNIG